MGSPFRLPPPDELHLAGREERMNIFRRFFASSRYNRLLIQQILVRSAIDQSLAPVVIELEKQHNRDFEEIVVTLRQYNLYEEFIAAAKEEDGALQKIREAYDKRMNGKG
ncbi:MAG: hypothetical protein MN733_16855 [Nitrososphaera sp.]|nr:hypothetical protein [Nitrososphaera sp.]